MRTKRRRAQQGKFQGGPVPYGFTTLRALERKLIREGKTEGEAKQIAGETCADAAKLYPVKEEIAIVKQIFWEYLRHNSLHKVGRELNSRGLRTRNGSLWSAESLRRILTNPVYLGIMRYGIHVHPGKTHKLKPKEDWIVAQGEHEPVITQEQFDHVQSVLASNQKPRRSGRVYLLSGLVKCGLCNGAMVGYSFRRKQAYYAYYGCNNWKVFGKSYCRGVNWNATKLENFVIEELQKLSTNYEFLTDKQKHIEELIREHISQTTCSIKETETEE